MDSLVAAAARCLSAGDPLGALKHVALREDPAARALRGIAMAQLGELARSRQLLRQAARGFGVHESLARARCVVAEAEVALAQRDLGHSHRALSAAARALDARGDRNNAWHARLIAVRRLLLIGRLDDAASTLAALDGACLPPALQAVASLADAEIALRHLRTAPAAAALARAHDAVQRSRIPALAAEVEAARQALERPAARRHQREGALMPLRLAEVEALIGSGALVVDGCRRGVQRGDRWHPLARRPLLFTLVQALTEAWPDDVARERLIECVFRIRRPDETHRARLRVEIGRLRARLAPAARIEATPRGFVLAVDGGTDVALLRPPIDGDEASLQALLADGAAWSTSALALAIGASQRTVQRALSRLHADGRVRCLGRGRARRWLAPPLPGFTTILLLPPSLPPA